MVPPPWKSVACCELSSVLRDSASVYLTQEDAVVQLLPRGGIKFTTATVGFLSLSSERSGLACIHGKSEQSDELCAEQVNLK
jgi:hypothetical protein